MNARSLLTALLVAAASCSDTLQPVPVASVAVMPGDTTLTSIGQTVTLHAVALDAGGNELTGRGILWSSSDPTVLAVDQAGEATAVGNGTATLTARADGVPGTATIAVAQVTSSVVLTPASTNLKSLGDSVGFAAVALDALGNVIADRTPGVAPTDTDVIVISAGHTGVAVGNGEALVIAAIDGHADTATVSVQQVPAQLAFVKQPLTTQHGVAIPDVTVAIRDARGNLVASATKSVSIALGPTLAGGVLSGTTQVNAVAGTATFSGLAVDVAGAGYTLSAVATGVPFATSSAFEILSSAARIDSVALNTASIKRGAATPYSIWVTNGAGRNLTGAGTQAYIIQNGLHGGGGSVAIGCSPTQGVIPHLTCKMNRSLSAPAALALGAATVRIVFFEGQVELARLEFPIEVVP